MAISMAWNLGKTRAPHPLGQIFLVQKTPRPLQKRLKKLKFLGQSFTFFPSPSIDVVHIQQDAVNLEQANGRSGCLFLFPPQNHFDARQKLLHLEGLVSSRHRPF